MTPIQTLKPELPHNRPKTTMLAAVIAAMTLVATLLVASPASGQDQAVRSDQHPLAQQPDGSYRWGPLELTGYGYDGAVADLIRTDRWQDDVIGIDGGRWNDQIDYDVALGGERVVIQFPTAADDVVVTVGMLGANEGGQGNDEAGVWRAFDAGGQLLATGRIDPDESALGPRVKERGYGQYPIEVSVDGVVRLELEAIDWNSAGSAPGRNNSDFGIVAIGWRSDSSAPTTVPPTTSPSTTAPTTVPPTTAPSTTAPSTTAPSTTVPPTTVPSSPERRSVDADDIGSTPGVHLEAFGVDGAPADLGSRRGSIGVDGGRYDFQLDYDAILDRSERLVVRLDGGADAVVVDLDMMASSEFRGLDETGRWLARDLDGSIVGEGWLDPSDHPDRSFPIAVEGTIGSVELTATAYGRGLGTDRITNNSDFALDRIHWSPPVSTPPTTAPSTTVPPTTVPPTTVPPTTAPSTTAAPSSTAPSTSAPSTTVPPTTSPTTTPSAELIELTTADRAGTAWGPDVTITALDGSGTAVEIGDRRGAFGPSSGRYGYQLDYDADADTSEALVFDFAIPVDDLVIGLRHLEESEWQGMNETGVWSAFAADGAVIGSGLIDPDLATDGSSGDRRFELDANGPISRLRIEATAYDHGLGTGRTSNNSDFAVVAMAYTPRAVASTTVPVTVDQTATAQPMPAHGDEHGASNDGASNDGASNHGASEHGATEHGAAEHSAVVAVTSGAWADPQTWGGAVPAAGQSVSIPAAVSVTIDSSPNPIGSLVVDGTLRFADTDLDVIVDSVMVRGLVVGGTETAPLASDISITLAGTDEHAMHGSRSLAVMDGGVLELHGASADKRSWTLLDGSVAPGATTLTLADPTGWEVGDRIVIAPTGIEAFEDEVVTIVGVDGQTISIEPSLSFAHHGAIERHDGRELDMRAEVGLLSRNIVIASPDDAATTLIGGHVMVMAGGSAQVEGVELSMLGQSGVAGRYPFHWHLAGDVSGQYLRNSSISGSLQRGVVVHGTSNALVEGVVAHDTFSHAFVWSEDGNEWGNRFIGNLAVRVENVDKSSGLISFPRTGRNGEPSLQISSQAETRSSGFWGRNPENTLIGNHVAGVDHGQGFFFDTRHMGYAMKKTMKTPVADVVFSGNVAHSIEGIPRGFYNYGPAARGHGVFVSTYAHHPVIELVDFTAYHAVTGAWIEDENTVLLDSIVADSAAGVFVHHAEVRSTVIVGPTGNDTDRSIGLLADRQIGGGVHVTGQGRGKGVRLTDVTFIGVDRAGIVVRYVGLDEPSEVSGLRFVDTDPILVLSSNRRPASGLIVDADGSLCGVQGASVRLGSPSNPC